LPSPGLTFRPELRHILTLKDELGCSRWGNCFPSYQTRDCTIPRYFFHLVKDGEIVAADVSGHECADDRAARQHAQRGDNLVAFRTRATVSLKGYSIQVVNEAGQVFFTVPLSKLQVT
jgi:hypothetical protein